MGLHAEVECQEQDGRVAADESADKSEIEAGSSEAKDKDRGFPPKTSKKSCPT